ncbi:MAG: hypothetical protein OSA99_14925 [Acidimicrobiales bacterium]|nr:hypothetical protein [Acidimicrobiales bacterium]
MKRLGALVGALVMVVAGLAVRGTFGGEDGDGAPRGAGTTDGVVCAAGLSACGAISEARTEMAGVTADALLEPDGRLDGAWIVPAAWADLVIAERARLGLDPAFEVDGDPLASSPVMVVVWSDRAAQLAARCDAPVDWTCLADQDGTPLAGGDRVHTGSPDVDSATGLPVAAAQAAGLLGTSSFAANDFTGSFNSRASRLAAGQRDDPVTTMRTQGPGRLTAASGVAADTTALTSNFGEIARIDELTPTIRVDVVALVPSGSSLDDETRRLLERILVDTGWDGPGTGDDGLPSGGVLAAIRTLWIENR